LRNWDKKRRENVSEIAIVSQIICTLILMIAALGFTPTHTTSIAYFIIILYGIGIIAYAGKKLVSGIDLAGKPGAGDFPLFLASFFFSALVIYYTGRDESPVKVIILIPVIVAATNYGRRAGMFTAGAAALTLLVYELLSGKLQLTPQHQAFMPDAASNPVFQADLVHGGVMLILAWLIGGFAEIEREVRQNLIELAHTDELTGLGNHRYFQDSIRIDMDKATKDGYELSLILLDINHFKFYNESLGHQAGDDVLKEMGAIVKNTVGQAGQSFRYGSDEFMVLAPAGPVNALALARKIKKQVEDHSFYRNEIQPGGQLTVSLGIASFPRHGKTVSELIHYANDALYRAKYGREKVQVYFSVMEDVNSLLGASEQELFNTIKTLVTVVNAKDRYTFGHSERVTFYALQLARRLGLPEGENRLLKYAAYLHDIGKIEIDRAILKKPGFLTPEEREMMNMHTVWGADIVRPLVNLGQISQLIRGHHENYDGSGFPDSLAGPAIPVGARILRLVDSYDAMTTDRPYKKAMTSQQACRELKLCKGTMFDPSITDVFIEIVESEPLEKLFDEGRWF
jgi:diguanylate cyclase (GGDEF)-like protein/putative nucleotidyltransferase with HDIG domain